MNHVTYPRKRLAELLGITESELDELETGDLASLGGVREEYPVSDLSAYRAAMKRYPERTF